MEDMTERGRFKPKEFRAPEGKGGGGGGKDYDPRLLEDRDRDLFYVDSSLQRMIKELKEIDKMDDKKKEESQEKLKKDYEKFSKAHLRVVGKLLNDELLRERNAIPYETREQDMLFSNTKEAIAKARDEEWADGPEATKWLDRIETDLIWGEGNLRVLKGMSGVLDKFFDGKQMMNWVRERMRSDPTAAYYEMAFAKEIPGLKAPEENEITPLRETAIKYQDDSVFWRLAVAAVGQIDHDNGGQTFMNLSADETKFIQLVFGDIDEDNWVTYNGGRTPKEILNWYSMASIESKKRQYLASMEYLLTMGVKDKLQEEDLDVKQMAEHAKGWIDKRLSEWYSPKVTKNELLARIVSRSGVVLDWGHMNVTRIGWGWEYEEKDGIIQRKFGSGGTTVATDITTPSWWRMGEASNQKKNWTRGTLLPMSVQYRADILSHAPDWEPGVPNGAELNPVLRKALSRLKSNFENDETFQKIENNMWYFETAFTAKDANGRAYNISIPIFFPPDIKSLNFWNTIPFEPGTKINQGASSIWDAMTDRKKMSDIKWTEMGDQALYRWMITIAQTLRFVTTMVEPRTKINEGQFVDFLESPGLEEFIKRADLGVRDEKENADILTMSLIPMVLVFRKIRAHGLFGENGRDKVRRTAMVSDMSEWIREFRNLNQEKNGIKNYGEYMAQLTIFYSTVILDTLDKGASPETKSKKDAYSELQRALKEDANLEVNTAT